MPLVSTAKTSFGTLAHQMALLCPVTLPRELYSIKRLYQSWKRYLVALPTSYVA